MSEKRDLLENLIPYGSGVNYDDYLKVRELTSLQNPLSSPPHHDEMLFIIIHQVYELWFKLVLHELDQAIEQIDRGEVLEAHHFINRCGEIFRILVSQIHILETMRPVDFLKFRDYLRPASGFQSVQFRELEFLLGIKDERYLKFFKDRPELHSRLAKRLKGRDLRTAYYQLLKNNGFFIPESVTPSELEKKPDEKLKFLESLLTIYKNPSKNLPLYLLTESLIQLDQFLILWRTHHLRVVERLIGYKPGTGGSKGVAYLQKTVEKKAFPYLWEVRTHLEK